MASCGRTSNYLFPSIDTMRNGSFYTFSSCSRRNISPSFALFILCALPRTEKLMIALCQRKPLRFMKLTPHQRRCIKSTLSAHPSPVSPLSNTADTARFNAVCRLRSALCVNILLYHLCRSDAVYLASVQYALSNKHLSFVTRRPDSAITTRSIKVTFRIGQVVAWAVADLSFCASGGSACANL